jgi:hypothetical protein
LNKVKYVGFEVLTAVVTKSNIFWDISRIVRCKSTDVSEEHIASIFRVEEHLLATCSHAGFLLGLFIDSEYEGDMFLRKVG